VRPFLIAATVGLGAVISSSVAFAQDAGAPTDPDVAPAAIARGRAIFRGTGNCLMCHGANLEGGAAPALTAQTWKDAKGGTYSAILAVVTGGVTGTAMLALPGGITPVQAQQVSAYVWAVSHGKAKV